MNPTLTTYETLESHLELGADELRRMRARQTKLLYALTREVVCSEREDGWWDGSWHKYSESLNEQFIHHAKGHYAITVNVFRHTGDECLSVTFTMPEELALPQDDFDVERLRAHFLNNPEDIYVE